MKFIRTISALLLAILVLVSSTSFIVGMHVCMGEVQTIAVLTKAEGCGMQKNLPPCHQKVKSTCCDDKTVVHRADDVKATVGHFHLDGLTAISVAQSLPIISEVIPAAPTARIRYYRYDPPSRSVDLTVEHSTFLI